MEEPVIEKRKFNRFVIITFVYSPEGALIGYTRDISIGGACINLLGNMFGDSNDKSANIIIKPVTDKYNLGGINVISQHAWGNIHLGEKGSFIGVQFKPNPEVEERIKEMILYFYGDTNSTNSVSFLN